MKENMDVKRLSLQDYITVKEDEDSRRCNAILNRCRREGYLLDGTFYYQTQDSRCWKALSYDYIVEDQVPTTASEGKALEEL